MRGARTHSALRIPGPGRVGRLPCLLTVLCYSLLSDIPALHSPFLPHSLSVQTSGADSLQTPHLSSGRGPPHPLWPPRRTSSAKEKQGEGHLQHHTHRLSLSNKKNYNPSKYLLDFTVCWALPRGPSWCYFTAPSQQRRNLQLLLFLTQQWPQDWKKSVFIPIPKKGNPKECSNYHTIALISYASKVMLKILQAGLQQYVNCELPDVQAGFRKGRGTRYQIANIHWIIKKAREFQKNIYFCFIDYAKAFDCVDHNKHGKF